MVTIQVKNIDGKTILPVPGSNRAAGYDLIAIDEPTIVGSQLPPEFEEKDWWRCIDYIEYKTQLFIAPEPDASGNDTHTLIHPRSSVRKYNMVLANSIGLIDADYRGEILVCFKYIWQPEDLTFGIVKDKSKPENQEIQMILGKVNYNKIYKKGEKIAQLVAEGTNRINFRLISELDETARGSGGFGSTDKLKSETNPSVFGTIAEAYQKAGGVPVRKRYIDEIREKGKI